MPWMFAEEKENIVYRIQSDTMQVFECTSDPGTVVHCDVMNIQ
jgi:hypothetical protein